MTATLDYRVTALADEVTRTVALHCPKCDRGARTRADAQLIAACEASLTASR